jgi:hypothetical protein
MLFLLQNAWILMKMVDKLSNDEQKLLFMFILFTAETKGFSLRFININSVEITWHIAYIFIWSKGTKYNFSKLI